jgi:hypothetical protein
VFTFIGKVVAGSVGVYVLNRVLKETGLLDRAIEVGMEMAGSAFTIVTDAAAKAQANATAANGARMGGV